MFLPYKCFQSACGLGGSRSDSYHNLKGTTYFTSVQYLPAVLALVSVSVCFNFNSNPCQFFFLSFWIVKKKKKKSVI